MPCPHLDDPARLPEVDELVEPVVDLLNLDADHVPEPGQVLAGRHEGVLLPAHVLKQGRRHKSSSNVLIFGKTLR